MLGDFRAEDWADAGESFAESEEHWKLVELQALVRARIEKPGSVAAESLNDLLAKVTRDGASSNEKGQALEDFTERMLDAVEGLRVIARDARLAAEEIDFVVENTVAIVIRFPHHENQIAAVPSQYTDESPFGMIWALVDQNIFVLIRPNAVVKNLLVEIDFLKLGFWLWFHAAVVIKPFAVVSPLNIPKFDPF